MKSNSFLPLYVTNFFGTLNDNFLKTLASFTVIGWISDERVKSVAMGVTAGALVLPYIICSPLADRLTAIWSNNGRGNSRLCPEVAVARHRFGSSDGPSKLSLLAR